MFDAHAPADPPSPGARTSPPYNMGLAWEAQKLNLHTKPPSHRPRANVACEALRVVVDKLRLSFYSSISPDDLPAVVRDVCSSRLGFARRVGSMSVPRCKAWTKPPRVEGGIYWQCDSPPFLPSGSSLIVCEFNPAKLDDDGWISLGGSLADLGVDDVGSLFVERYDGAVDYIEPRRNLLLSDTRRLMDMWGIGRHGPETERTGFRTKSKLRAQLYDKTAEQRSKGIPCVADLVRFELMVTAPPAPAASPLYGERSADSLSLGDLPYCEYPGGDITVRAMAYQPLRVANHVYGSLTAYARGLGLRAAMGYAVQVFQLRSTQRDQWLSSFLPVLDNDPARMWSRKWPTAAGQVLDQIRCARIAA